MNTATSSHSIEKINIPAKSVNKMNTFNKHFNSSNEVIDLTDEIHSNISVIEILSDDEIIDITNTICVDNNYKSKNALGPLKKKSHSITHNTSDTIIIDWNEHENSKTIPKNQIISICNDVQILNHSACTQNNPNEIITISDDSDEENSLLQLYNKTKIDSNLIKERFNNIVNPLKRTYNSPLRNFKKKSKVEYAHNPETLTSTIGAFVIDKRKMFSYSQKFLSSRTSKTKRQLRPIIIDGLNIGHA